MMTGGNGDNTWAGPAPVVDFRTAAASDERERRLGSCVAALRRLARQGSAVDVVWPADRDLAAVTRAAGMPPADLVADLARGGGVALTVHTRMGSDAGFAAMRPVAGVRFLFHLNGEVAAMCHERRDAAPSLRLGAALRLARLGWRVEAVVGTVSFDGGWREDYADLAGSMAAAGLDASSLLFGAGCDDRGRRVVRRLFGLPVAGRSDGARGGAARPAARVA